jgi:hypothetical protein
MKQHSIKLNLRNPKTTGFTMGDRLGLEPDSLVHDVALDLDPRPPE